MDYASHMYLHVCAHIHTNDVHIVEREIASAVDIIVGVCLWLPLLLAICC